MEALFRNISEHLRSLNFETVVEHGIIKASRPDFFYFWIIPIQGGALIRTLFTPGEAAKRQPRDFLAFVNRINEEATITRFVWKADFLAAEAWFPDRYEPTAFEAFFNRYATEITCVPTIDKKGVEMFFPVPAEDNR
jgi:hypothetical protein